jgi:wobble nucleotide-excising tRNase
VDFINDGLKYVFFSENRLTVGVENDYYVLKSNGKSVKPRNISLGERNILSLCYFFTELLNNVDEKDVHKSECLIVLDDPVSSFDLENRVGIISYLKSLLM